MSGRGPGHPLVEPSPPLSREELERYARHLTLPQVGVDGQRRLKNARILIIGAGGLGSPALHYLAAAGAGTLGVVDDDVVSVSNLQRQVAHTMADVGRAKVDSAADAVARINPLVTVVRHGERLTPENAVELFRAYDLVLDGADNFATRYLVSDAAGLAGVPVVWGSILRFDGQIAVFWAGHGPTYRDVYPEPPPPGEVPSCAEGGVFGMLPAVVGSVMVTEAVKLVTGIGEPLLGRLLVHDALAQTWRTLRIEADPNAAPVTDLSDVQLACGLPAPESGPTDDEVVDPAWLALRLERRDRGEADFTLVDVREDWERELVVIPGSVAVPLADIVERGAAALPPQARSGDVVLHCKAGIRSAQALNALRPHYAFREEAVRHLGGGVLAWIDDIDPSLPRY